MRKMLSCFALVAVFACGNAFAQEAATPAADAAPAAAPATETPAAEAPAAEAAAAEAPAAEAPAAEAPAAEAPATEAPAATDTPAATTETAAAPAAVSNGKIGAPQEGKGQIVFFREKKFAGSAIRYKVREGDKELGKLTSGSYFVLPVEPGTHEYAVHSEAKDVLTMEVEAGETYYVIGTVTMGFFAGRPNLSPSDQATFDKMSAKLALAK